MRFISRKEARSRLGGISPVTLWRMQKRGQLPPSLNAPGAPFAEDKFEEALERLAQTTFDQAKYRPNLKKDVLLPRP